MVRSTMWTRIEFEDELPPSFEALWRHWQHVLGIQLLAAGRQ